MNAAMKRAATTFAVAILAGCATAQTAPQDMQVTITASRVAQCKAQGGCSLLSLAEVTIMLTEAHEEGRVEGRTEKLPEMDTTGCRRGKTKEI